MNKLRAAMLTLVLTSGVALAPAPAQAQFGIFFGDEERDFIPERVLCLDDRDIRAAVAAEG